MQQPLITVGMPVYNAQRYLAQAIESVLAQTWYNLEIVISDNASSDGTASIVQSFMQRDPRIRYFRFDSNQGVAKNWNAVVWHARGSYFKWLGSNDLMNPELLERCAQVLNSQREVVLCFGRTRWIDEDGNTMDLCQHDFAVDSGFAPDRFLQLVFDLSVNNPMNGGLIRIDALRKTRLDPDYPHGDRVLIAELAMHGKFVLLDEELFRRRVLDNSPDPRRTPMQLERLYNPQATRPRRFLRLRRHFGYLNAIMRGPLSTSERVYSLFGMMRFWLRRSQAAHTKSVMRVL